MNSCILMVEISTPPQLRHTPDNLEVAEMMVLFPGLRPDDPPATLRVVGWGKTASEIHTNYQPGDRVIVEGRLGMRTVERPEGFKEKRAELTVQRIYRVGSEFNLGNPMAANSMAANSMATNSMATNSMATMNNPPVAPAPIPNYEPSTPPPQTNYQPSYQPSYQPPAAAPTPNFSEEYDSDDIPF